MAFISPDGGCISRAETRALLTLRACKCHNTDAILARYQKQTQRIFMIIIANYNKKLLFCPAIAGLLLKAHPHYNKPFCSYTRVNLNATVLQRIDSRPHFTRLLQRVDLEFLVQTRENGLCRTSCIVQRRIGSNYRVGKPCFNQRKIGYDSCNRALNTWKCMSFELQLARAKNYTR